MQKTLHRATFRRLICVAFAMIGFSVIAIGVTLLALRDDALRDATTDSGNIAGVLAAQTERSVQAAEIVLAELRERIDADRATSPGDFARVYSTPAVHELLKERRGRLPQSDFIFIADHKGKLVNTSRTWPIPELGLSDREFFRFLSHRDNGDQRRKLHISLPVMARVTGDSIIVFSSGLVDAKGEFLGVVGVALKTEYFHNIYNALTAIRGQSLALVRRDGAVLVRHPAAASDVGKTIAPYSPWYALAARGGGNFRTTDTAEPGDTHLVAVRPLRDYPLVVNVEVSQSAALKHWRGRAILIGVGTILAVLCSAFLLAALSKQFQRLLDSEASLAEREARLEDKTHELKGANERLDAAMNNMSHGLCMFDKDGRLLVCNERFMRTYSLPPEVVRPGARARDILRYRKEVGTFSGDVDQYIRDTETQLSQGRSVYRIAHTDDGRVIAVHNLPIAGGGWVGTHEDITERQRAEARIAHMARHDALTDLANRVLFREKLDEALARLRRYDEGFCVFVFDLDLFKAVNDTLGHPIGDALLQAVAARLRATVRETDTVGRLGGDEFAVLQAVNGDQREGAVVLASRLMKAICAPYDIDGHQIVIGISVGIALAPENGAEVELLLKNADLALYRAKSEGRNGYRFFAPDMDVDARLRLAIEIDLRNAISPDRLKERNDFELHFQSVTDVATRSVCGFEALVRWRHRDHGLIPPNSFIPLAEELGLIIPLGEWILRAACRHAATWPQHIKLAVNLSPVQFRDGNLVEIVVDALLESELAPHRLELEITESVLLQNNVGNLDVLRQLRSLGVGIVLDDFGTGYSSLSYLRMFPFDKVKIDRSFVSELSTRVDCAAIVCAITGLGRSLNMLTTAEGVETQDQFELLRAAGCTQAQGYLFSKPLPVEKLDFNQINAVQQEESVA